MHAALDRVASESDHTTVILGAALVETALKMAVRARMYPNLTKADETMLFEGDAPLATFSSKIRIAFAFEVIDEKMKSELNKLRDIRNAFAHSNSFLSFEIEEVRAVCANLTMPEYDTGAPWHIDGDNVLWSPVEPRDRFLVSVRLTWLFLYQEIHNPPKWIRS
jgi:hypothetical protein